MVPSIATRKSMPRIGGTCPPISTSPTRAAAAGRTIARASRSTGKTSPAPRPHTRSGTCEQQANRLANAFAALGVARGDQVALMLPQRPETVVAHIAIYRMRRGRRPAFVPVRTRGARISAAEFARRRSRSSIRNRCRISLPIRARAARISPHVIGVAGARETGVTPFGTLLEPRHRISRRSPRARPILRCSSTRAEPPDRRRAR